MKNHSSVEYEKLYDVQFLDTHRESYTFHVGKSNELFRRPNFSYMNESSLKIIDDPTAPDVTLQPPSFLVSVEYNVKDPNILAGGCYNGQVSTNKILLV